MKTKKLNLNKQVISNLNTVNGGYAPTHDCGGDTTTVIIPKLTIIDCLPPDLSLNCITKLESVCRCW